MPLGLHAGDDVIVRASVQPEEAWQGQRVQLTVVVLGKDSWAQIPNMPALKVGGAYVLPPESQGVRAQEQIDGVSYTGQRYELSVYPQVGGEIVIPETSLQVSLSSFGSGSAAQEKQEKLPEIRFRSKVPPGAEGVDWLVSTTDFKAEQTWSSEAKALKVGESLKRTIRISASDVSGMAFKPIEYPAIEGLGVYPAEAVVRDKRDRGTLSGERQEEVTYIFEGAGEVVIPDIELVWWNVQEQKLESVPLAGRKVTVSGGSPVGYREAEESGVSGRGGWWLLALVGVILGMGVWRREWISAWLEERKVEREQSEKAYFKRFEQASRSGDVAATQRAVMAWLDRVSDGSQVARLDVFLKRYGDGGRDVTQLWGHTEELYAVVSEARKVWASQRHRRERAERLLPPLNS
ncbi:BatD family protein [Rubritalea tangerina]|uniref:BatD family protein n=2 Tax=Rubritalea tangerina TaxID=430798 RepID=A0ABW4ZA29_9BACT